MSLEPDVKALLEPDSELMEMFKDKAPGTFRHCDSVAQLTDAVCGHLQSIKRDILFPAAKLHDIGKICNPEFFAENQPKDSNIHDDLDVEVSFQYLSRHVSDSLMILLQYPCISREVLEVISQHHGNSPIRSICGDNLDCDKFRYIGKPPQSLEACTLMICDVVEAATRALFTKGKLNDIKQTVTQLIDVLVEDKQLDYLRIGELRVIRKVLCDEVGNLYHKRVDYDKE